MPSRRFSRPIDRAANPVEAHCKTTLKEPVWVDTITSGMYELPMERMIVEGEKLVFKDVPVYDAPTLIADKSLRMP